MAYFGASVVVNWALSQVGYKEGANNWNKYAQELDSINYFTPQKKQGVAWCAIFVDDAVYNATGKDKSKTYSVLYQPSKDNLSASCKYAAKYYRAANAWYKTAKVGDQVFFGSEGAESHTGIVVSVGVSTITTVEGNKGNAVKKCLYNKNDSKIAGYGRPRYDSDPQPEPPKPKGDTVMVEMKVLQPLVTTGNDVKTFQRLTKALGYYKGKIDGDYGKLSAEACKAFQKARGLKPDAWCGQDTWTELLTGG